MTSKELAGTLNGRQYGNEMTRDEREAAGESGLVVVFGGSDDLMEFRGAIDDEVGCYDGGIAHVTKSGLFENECDEDNCPYANREREKMRAIEAVWCDQDSPAWTYRTDIPHETFDIFEDDEVYCRGIVFSLTEV